MADPVVVRATKRVVVAARSGEVPVDCEIVVTTRSGEVPDPVVVRVHR